MFKCSFNEKSDLIFKTNNLIHYNFSIGNRLILLGVGRSFRCNFMVPISYAVPSSIECIFTLRYAVPGARGSIECILAICYAVPSPLVSL